MRGEDEEDKEEEEDSEERRLQRDIFRCRGGQRVLECQQRVRPAQEQERQGEEAPACQQWQRLR